MIDTHAHLNDERLLNDFEQIILDCKQNGISKIVCASYDLLSSKTSIELSDKCDILFATIGTHPHDSKLYNDDVEKEYINMAKNKKVVAFGEIGLDYHYDLSPRKIQREIFERQLILADKLKLPVVIHTREAIGDTIEILESNKKYINNGLVFHCYNASYDITKKFLKENYKFSFGGSTTYKNNKIVDTIKILPTDSYFLETDCPYLAPEPFRNQTNYPKHVNLVAENIANITCKSINEVERYTDENAIKFFNLK